jgi:sugar phosphate isomerase/epimerase
MNPQLTRRSFLAASAMGLVQLTSSDDVSAGTRESSSAPAICAFIKPLQSLSFAELADAMAELGLQGIEATVRKGGYVAPEEASAKLPLLVRALESRGLRVTLMTTDVLRADRQSERLLQVAADQGITRYRMGLYQYDLKLPIHGQLDALRPEVAKLAGLSRKVGIQALYQNHSGETNVGGTIWDVYQLIKDLPSLEIDLAFDIRHATIEAGMSWPVLYHAVKHRVSAVYVKDFTWNGSRARHVPLGTGRINPTFFSMLQSEAYQGPYSLHVEYLLDRGATANLAAFRRDLAILISWMST